MPCRAGKEEKISDCGENKGRKHYYRKLSSNEKMTDHDILEAASDKRGETYFTRIMMNGITPEWVNGISREGGAYKPGAFQKIDFIFGYIGGCMEISAAELQIVNEQAKASKEILQELHNEVRAVHDQVSPLLRKQIAEIRDARMSAVSEIQSMLVMLRDIRKFFLESDYDKELARLKEFIKICKELEELKNSGMLDAVSDTIIKLTEK